MTAPQKRTNDYELKFSFREHRKNRHSMKPYFIFMILMSLVMPIYGQVTFIAPIKNVTKGDVIGVEIRVKTRDSISALQFTLEWSPTVLEFKSTDSVMLPSSSMEIFGLNSVAQGNLKFLWLTGSSDGINIPDSSMIFKLNFKAIGEKGTSSDIKFTNSLIKIKALNPKIESLVTNVRDGKININMTSAVGSRTDLHKKNLLHQNIPNPVQNFTTFPFEMTESEEASLEIFDTLGRKIFQKKEFFNVGFHQIDLNTEGVLRKGIYIYGIRTKRGFLSRTLTKI